ncbi:MAG TPA: hypothetical protein VEC11_09275 [Allosphingosinicella sp.]|nr:hypothetical protein [Allosphingosinicella sp.]
MIGALAAALLTWQAAAPMPFSLNHFMDLSAALDGRWVEFDAYVVLMRRPGGPPTLNALTGEMRTQDDGTNRLMCADDGEATLAVVLGRDGFGPLSRRAARPRNAYVGVRIRGFLRARPFGFRVGNFEHEWVGSVDHARIVRLTGGRCLINYPEIPGQL